MTEKELIRIADFIDDNANDAGFSFTSNDFLKNPNQFIMDNKEKLREIPGWFSVEPSMSTPNKAARTLLEEYNDFDKIPKAYLNEFAEKNNTSIDELREAFETNKSMDSSINMVDDEAKAREQRRKELEQHPYASMLMSEASKRRYIDDPESSVFYQEKLAAEGNKDAHPLSGTWSDRFDAALGGAAAGMDMVPGPVGVFVGPTLRALRSGKNYILGEDDKDALDIAKEIGSDYMSNIGVDYLPTAVINTAKKIGKNMSKDFSKLGEAVWEGGVLQTWDKMKKDLKELGSLTKDALKKESKIVEGLDAPTKKLREQGLKTGKEINLNKKFEDDLSGNFFAEDIKELAKKEGITELEAAKKYSKAMEEGAYKKYYTPVEMDGKKYNIATKESKKEVEEGLGKKAAEFAKTIPQVQSVGSAGKGVQVIGKNAGGLVKASADYIHDSKTPKSKYNKEEQLKRLGLKSVDDYGKELDKIIEDTSDQWEAGFTPIKIEGDPMYEAWKKYQRSKK